MSDLINIGLLTPIVDGFYFGGLIDSISDYFNNPCTRLFVMQTSKHIADKRIMYNYPLALDYIDGWIVLPQAVYPEYLDMLCKTGKPVVMISREIDNSLCSYVLSDNVEGMAAAVEHLIDHGHERIAFVGWLQDFDVSQRFEGYKAALERKGLEYSPELVFNIDNCMQSGGFEAARKILESGIRFTAIAAGSDFNAVGIIQKLQEAGCKVPENIAVVGYDNTDIGEKFSIPLTSVDQKIYDLGMNAAKFLLERIKREQDRPGTVYVGTSLIQRQSCGCSKPGTTSVNRSGYKANSQKVIEFLSNVIQSSFGIGDNLIKASSEEIKSLSWINSTSFHWACLGLFDNQKHLFVDRILNKNSSETSTMSLRYSMEAFPPLQYLPPINCPAEGSDIVWLHPIATQTHEWGVLVLVGPFIKTKLSVNFDTMTHWYDLLTFALEREALSENRYRNLLNNTAQGFLSFGEDLTVDKEYSSECRKIFGREIDSSFLPELIYPEDPEQQTFLRHILSDLLGEIDEKSLKMYMELLPEEVVLNKRNIKIEYKLIKDFNEIDSKKFMLILTDITDKRKLESKIEYEKNVLKMVIRVVVDSNNFIETVNDYLSFCRHTLVEMLDSDQPLSEVCPEILRCVHTFKGNFSQYDMVNVVARLHDFESDISDIRKYIDFYTRSQFKELILENDMVSWLRSDIAILKGILGEQYFNRGNMLSISEKRLKEIERRVVNILSPAECKNFLHEFRKLRYKPIKELLGGYVGYTRKLSERLKKCVHFYEIESAQEINVDTEIYGSFSKSLVNVFRNMIEHGIETPDERINAGKDEYGLIYCSVKNDDNKMHIVISDDGRGLDFDKIRNKALEKGVYTADKIEDIPDNELVKLIFEDDFSTSDRITDVSGRGVGLSAVRKEVERLGGEIRVESRKNEGTAFHFIVPFVGVHDLVDINIKSFTHPIFETAKNVFSLSFGLEPVDVVNFRTSNEKRIKLDRITSFIKIKGTLDGNFFLSVNLELAKCMVRSFILEEITEEEENLIIEDVLSECTNTILGNSLGLFGDNEEFVSIETPETIYAEDGYIKYSEANIFICNLKFREGNATLGLAYHDSV